MYKTVRQGENSLQYTILPQTEEVLTKSGMKGRGRDFSPTIQVRRRKTKPGYVYCLLFIFGCLLTIAVAAVPIYIVSKTLSGNTPNIKQTLNVDKSMQDYIYLENPVTKGQSKKKELKYNSDDTTTVTQPTTSEQIPLKPAWAMPAFKSFWKASTQIPTTIEPTVEDPAERILPPFDKNKVAYRIEMITDRQTKKPLDIFIRPTAVPVTSTVYKMLNSISKPTTPKSSTRRGPISFHDVLITSKLMQNQFETSTPEHKKQFNMDKFEDLKNSFLSLDDDDDFKGNVEVEEGNNLLGGLDDVKVSQMKPKGGWPFVDPSSYFQYSDATAGDKILLLKLLAAVLATVCFGSAVMCFAFRKRNISRRQQNIGKLTSDLQPDDNTNLLTAEEEE